MILGPLLEGLLFLPSEKSSFVSLENNLYVINRFFLSHKCPWDLGKIHYLSEPLRCAFMIQDIRFKEAKVDHSK